MTPARQGDLLHRSMAGKYFLTVMARFLFSLDT